MTGEELEEALKDLDLNKDGVVDFSEFQRWWFSGFKSYSGTRRSMIKMQKQAVNAAEALMKGNLDSPLSGDLKLKKHQVEVSFNAQEKPGTKICLGIYPGGDSCYKIHADLKSKYADTIDKAEADKIAKK